MNAMLHKNLMGLQKHHSVIYQTALPYLQSHLTHIPTPLPDCVSIETIQQQIQHGMDFAYCIGMSEGAVLQQSAKIITQENRGIVVIEPDAGLFLAALHQCDFTFLFINKKIFWAVGGEWHSQLETVWNTSHCYAASKPVFFHGKANESTTLEVTSYIQQNIQSRKQQLNRQIKNLPETLKRQTKSPVRIWCFEDLRGKQKYSLIQHALIRTLFHHWREMGCEVEYLCLVDGEYYPPYYRIIRLAEFQPNVIFLCNKSPAYEFALGAELSRSLPIPKIVWHADDPVYGEHLLERYKVTGDESHWVADYGWQKTLERYGAQDVQYLPGAVTKTKRGKKRGYHQCDIVFVGQVRDQSQFFAGLSPGWKTYAEQVINEKLRFPRKDLVEVLNQFSKPEPIALDLFDELKQKILWEANTRFRLQIIKGLKEFDLRIYGNDAWLKWLPPDVAKRCFRGVAHYKRLFDIYRNARITLNIHSLQTYTCMNVRDFDVPAAGGFLLSDWLPRAEDIYQPGFVSDLPLNEPSCKQVFFYRSIPELQKIAAYFVAHEDQRLECIEKARAHVLENHTYKHRAETLYHYILNSRAFQV